tara:strand:+ start:277 stop:588 length:312 start_codon:yes stop_codon:yes gene_type:complete
MAITERRIMQVKIDKWDEMIALEREFQKIEKDLGIPSKKRWLRCKSGTLGFSNLIWERDWENVGESEQAYIEMSKKPEMADLIKRTKLCITEMHNEYYQIVEV